MRWLYVHLRFSGVRSFEIALGCSFIAMVFAANLINVAGLFTMIRLSYGISTELQSTLFEEYLARPYIFHAKTNTAVVFNNVVQETKRIANDVLQSAFPLVTNILTGILIIASIVWLNPAVAAAIVIALGGGYALIYLVLRNWLLRSGEIQSRFLIEQTKTLNESLGAIKEILVLSDPGLFPQQFRTIQPGSGKNVSQRQTGESKPEIPHGVRDGGGSRAPCPAQRRTHGRNWIVAGAAHFRGFCGLPPAAHIAAGLCFAG